MKTNTRIASDKTKGGYRCAFGQFALVTGARKPKHVDDDRLAEFIGHLRDGGYSPHTVVQKLACLIAYATDRAKRGMCKWPTIKVPPLPAVTPKALTIEQVESLMKSARETTGMVGDVPAGEWWGSILTWFWCTGERTEATLTGVSLSNLTGDTIVIDAKHRKGRRKAKSYVLPDHCIEQMRSVHREGNDTVWHWPMTTPSFYRYWRLMYKRAGLTYVPYKTGPHQIRKSYASHIEANGGNATEALGHSSRSITQNSYLDPRIAKPQDFGSLLPKLGGM